MSTISIPIETQTLINAMIKEFTPAWELNDPGHRVEHFTNVFNCAMYINDSLDLGYDPNMIAVVSYCHDLFAWSRKNHHLMSGLWVETSEHLLLTRFTSTQLSWMADACREHRASFKGKYSREFSQLMASGNRTEPKSIKDILARAEAYYRFYNPNFTVHEVRAVSWKHLQDKYGKNGYARYPEMYKNVYQQQLDEIQIRLQLPAPIIERPYSVRYYSECEKSKELL